MRGADAKGERAESASLSLTTTSSVVNRIAGQRLLPIHPPPPTSHLHARQQRLAPKPDAASRRHTFFFFFFKSPLRSRCPELYFAICLLSTAPKAGRHVDAFTTRSRREQTLLVTGPGRARTPCMEKTGNKEALPCRYQQHRSDIQHRHVEFLILTAPTFLSI